MTKLQIRGNNTRTQILLDLSGSWEDGRPTEQIVKELKEVFLLHQTGNIGSQRNN